MVVNYTQDGTSITTALEKTFDGDHPCNLCVVVKEGRDAEKQQEVAKTLVKYEAVLLARPLVVEPCGVNYSYAELTETAERIAFPPLSPPPLSA